MEIYFDFPFGWRQWLNSCNSFHFVRTEDECWTSAFLGYVRAVVSGWNCSMA